MCNQTAPTEGTEARQNGSRGASYGWLHLWRGLGGLLATTLIGGLILAGCVSPAPPAESTLSPLLSAPASPTAPATITSAATTTAPAGPTAAATPQTEPTPVTVGWVAPQATPTALRRAPAATATSIPSRSASPTPTLREQPTGSRPSGASTPTPTVVPDSGRGTPILSEGVPVLSRGTREEAQRAVGVAILLPSYVPAGAVPEEKVFYYARQGGGMASLAYQVGRQHLAIEYLKNPAGEAPLPEGQSATVGRFSAVVYTQSKEPSDPLPPTSGVIWRDGGVTIRVTGDLPPAELLRVAQSMY